jgi:hypothetical protein
VTLPETLTALDLEDLMTALGHPTDRTNCARPLAQTPIAGVVAPTKRGQPWRVPREALLDTVAGILRRRAARAAAAGGWGLGPLERYHLPAARLLMERRELVPLVPDALRRRVRAERREARAAAAERLRRAEAERARRREQRQREQDESWRNKSALSALYYEVRNAAHAQWFTDVTGPYMDTPRWAAFEEEWPLPPLWQGVPGWWRPPPGTLERMRERTDAWIDGKCKDHPDGRDLVPDVDLTQPWPWRAEPADA